MDGDVASLWREGDSEAPPVLVLGQHAEVLLDLGGVHAVLVAPLGVALGADVDEEVVARVCGPADAELSSAYRVSALVVQFEDGPLVWLLVSEVGQPAGLILGRRGRGRGQVDGGDAGGGKGRGNQGVHSESVWVFFCGKNKLQGQKRRPPNQIYSS